MHRNCRVLSVFRNQCGCRHFATSTATQLKPKPRDDTATIRSTMVPTSKAWNIPANLLKRKDWSRPLLSPTQTSIKSSPRGATSSGEVRQTGVSPLSSPAPKTWSRPTQQSPPTAPNVATLNASQKPTLSAAEKSTAKQCKVARAPLASSSETSKAETSKAGQLTQHQPSQLQPRKSISSSQSNEDRRTPIVANAPITRTTNSASSTVKAKQSSQQAQRSTNQRTATQSKSREVQGNKMIQKASVVKTQTRRRGRRRDVFIPSTLTVATLASILRLKLDYLLSKMKRIGMIEEASYDYILSADYAALIADELGFNPVINDEAAFDIHPPPPHPNPASLPCRPPIVTIMGHVDHGKTTLLDTLRSASVAKGEAGGITQHIGAFSVPVKTQTSNPGAPQTITFLDTPGHAAFSAMRARGADVTDIIVLVVAADDGIMPQTREVINILKKEDSQMNLVVAINKVDKPGVDTDAVKKSLMAEGIQLEEFGGDVPAVSVSGLTGHGLPELVETLSAVAEMQDLRAEHDGQVYGHVIESNVHKGLGPIATVLVRRGCLKRGSQIISGLSHGKIRLMTDSKGASVSKALPGMAVTVSGWKTLPKAGDEVLEGSDSDIKKALSNRERKAEAESMQEDIEAINMTRRQERDTRAENKEGNKSIPVAETSVGPKQVKVYIKADVSGSAEALEGALDAMGNQIAVSKVIATGVGDVTESDVMRAQAANAIIVGFSVSVSRTIRTLAAQNEVAIYSSDVIYRLIEDVRSCLIALLPPIIETKVLGEADVLQVFEIQLKGGKTMKVAGCRVINGVVEKQKSARVVRAGQIIHEGALDTFRQLKKDITEARKGVECGVSLKDYSDLQAGDLLQMYDTIEKPGVL